MPDGIILYRSKYGATRRYAGWLAEETGFDCVDLKQEKPQRLEEYGTVILGGGVYASGIAGLAFLRKNRERLRGKRLAVFCVGASPCDEKAVRELSARNLTGELADVPCFYCRGSWEMARMNPVDRALCRMLQRATAGKAPEECEPWELALREAGEGPCDWTERAYLAPLLRFLNGEGTT